MSKHQARVRSWVRGQDGGSPCIPLLQGAGKPLRDSRDSMHQVCRWEVLIAPRRASQDHRVQGGMGKGETKVGWAMSTREGRGGWEHPSYEYQGPGRGWIGEGKGRITPTLLYSSFQHAPGTRAHQHLGPHSPTRVGRTRPRRALDGCPLGSGMATFSSISGQIRQQESGG